MSPATEHDLIGLLLEDCHQAKAHPSGPAALLGRTGHVIPGS